MHVPTCEVWSTFQSRHQGHRFLGLDPLLPIKPEMLRRMRRKLPRLISQEDLSFEEDLSQAAPHGFFFQRALLSRNDADSNRLKEEFESLFSEEPQIRWHLEQQDGVSDPVYRLLQSYLGWLLLCPAFREELSKLRAQWAVQVEALGRIPSLDEIPVFAVPRDDEGNRKYELNSVELVAITYEQKELQARVGRFVSGDGSQFLRDFAHFYRRWELQGLTHWEKPVPQFPMFRPQPGTWGNERFDHQMTWSIPWSLTRRSSVKLSDLMRIQSAVSAPAHLNDWLNSKGKLGPKQLDRVVEIHEVVKLILEPRYSECKQFNRSKIDEILSASLSCPEKVIKDLRLRLQRLQRTQEAP